MCGWWPCSPASTLPPGCRPSYWLWGARHVFRPKEPPAASRVRSFTYPFYFHTPAPHALDCLGPQDESRQSKLVTFSPFPTPRRVVRKSSRQTVAESKKVRKEKPRKASRGEWNLDFGTNAFLPRPSEIPPDAYRNNERLVVLWMLLVDILRVTKSIWREIPP